MPALRASNPRAPVVPGRPTAPTRPLAPRRGAVEPPTAPAPARRDPAAAAPYLRDPCARCGKPTGRAGSCARCAELVLGLRFGARPYSGGGMRP